MFQQVRLLPDAGWRGRIRAVHSVQDGKAEVIEAEALDTSPLVGRPLREAGLPEESRAGR